MPINKQIKQTENAKVLIVDDNQDLIRLMEMRLKPMKFQLRSANSAEQALSILTTWTPNLVITDLQMPGMSGMDLFTKLHAEDPLLPIIILTAHGTIPDAVEATQCGVTSFLTKPFDSKVLLREVNSALINSGFQQRDSNAKPRAITEAWRSQIVSKSPVVETLLNQIDRLAETDNLLLFRGAAGTGKSLLTRAAHDRSHRKEGPYVYISCKSLPQKLLELEVFGRIGAGTIEAPEHLGLLRKAKDGTFVLNDFESATPAFLQKLLYALIDQKVRPVDAQSSIDIDVRAMATTLSSDGYLLNDKLAWELSEQLGVTAFKVPAINERREDIPLIANATIEMMEDKVDLQFSNKAMEALTTANWQGNVRQLSNTVRQIARLSTNKIISESLVKSRLNKSTYEIQPLSSAHLDFERKYLTDTLKATNGNVTKASLIAERNRTEFHRLLKKHKIEACLFRH